MDQRKVRMLYFAVWAMLYGLSYSLSQRLFPAAVPYAVLAYAVLLIVWLGCRGYFGAFRIRRPVLSGRTGITVMALLLILPAANLISGGSFAGGSTAVLMAGTVIVEEVFFRGVLLADPGSFGNPLMEWMAERPDHTKVILSSGLFAVFHAVNAISKEEWIQVIPQIIFAFCAGVFFAAVTFRTNSLIPAAVCHFLVNITASEENAFSLPAAAGSMICLAAGILLLLPAGHIRKGTADEVIH